MGAAEAAGHSCSINSTLVSQQQCFFSLHRELKDKQTDSMACARISGMKITTGGSECSYSLVLD